jgi:hypothetical protein
MPSYRYAFLSALCALALYRLMPETRNAPLENIQELFDDPYPTTIFVPPKRGSAGLGGVSLGGGRVGARTDSEASTLLGSPSSTTA